MRIKEVEAKSVLTKSNLPDADFVINPYVGCSHACVYCYADFMKRFTGHNDEEWGEFVDVKVNAAELIDVSKIGKDGGIVIGSVCDPYQACEVKYEVTRKCLDKLKGFEGRIDIITKSALVLRDVELLKEFKNLRVCISIGILDEDAAGKLDPGAALPSERVEALRKLHDAGIYTVLFVSPIFPEISDVSKLIDSTKDFVDEFWFENLNIRANNREKVFSFLRKSYPELVEFYSGLSDREWNEIKDKIVGKCKKEGLKYNVYFFHGGKKK